VKASSLAANKSLKDAASPLDSFSRRMLRILCAAFRCPLAVIAIGFIGISRESPEMAYSRIQNSIRENDWEKVYLNLSDNSKNQIQLATTMVSQHVVAATGKKKDLSAKELFANVVSKNEKLRSYFEKSSYTVVSVSKNGNKSTITITEPNVIGTSEIQMVKEYATWRLDINLSEKPNKSLKVVRHKCARWTAPIGACFALYAPLVSAP
jgi:uncharacterized membrane protein YvbJ